MAIEDKLSYCNPQGPVTFTCDGLITRPLHTPPLEDLGLLYYLIIKDHRVVKTLCILRHAATEGLHFSTAELFTRAIISGMTS